MSFKPILDTTVTTWHSEFDVVVLGFGGAGACAAIEAHDNGARVAIFEAASAAGGSTALSSAELYLGGGTDVQKACGYTDTVDAMYGYLMDANGPQADAAKTRDFAAGSAEHLTWLKSLGVPFKNSEYPQRAMMALTDDCLLYTGSEKAWPYVERYKPAPRGHNLQVAGDNGGPLFMKLMAEAVVERGINTYFDARALRLIIDDSQRVVGVVVRMDMQIHYIHAARGVILCCGGFVMNQAMVAKYAPELSKATVPIGNPNDTGAGIQMGLSVGAAAINMHEGFVSLPYYPPATLTYGILVNAQGQRFINEDAYHGRVGAFLLRQELPVYFIMTVDAYADYERVSYLGAPIAGTGETLEELAQELNLPPGTLAATVTQYNQSVIDGADPLFHKAKEWLQPLEGALVALDCTPGQGAFLPYFTLGGLDTLPTGEVLNYQGELIPGLYAAGRSACGVPRRGDGYASGTSVADATFSGRRAGRAAAATLENN